MNLITLVAQGEKAYQKHLEERSRRDHDAAIRERQKKSWEHEDTVVRPWEDKKRVWAEAEYERKLKDQAIADEGKAKEAWVQPFRPTIGFDAEKGRTAQFTPSLAPVLNAAMTAWPSVGGEQIESAMEKMHGGPVVAPFNIEGYKTPKDIENEEKHRLKLVEQKSKVQADMLKEAIRAETRVKIAQFNAMNRGRTRTAGGRSSTPKADRPVITASNFMAEVARQENSLRDAYYMKFEKFPEGKDMEDIRKQAADIVTARAKDYQTRFGAPAVSEDTPVAPFSPPSQPDITVDLSQVPPEVMERVKAAYRQVVEEFKIKTGQEPDEAQRQQIFESALRSVGEAPAPDRAVLSETYTQAADLFDGTQKEQAEKMRLEAEKIKRTRLAQEPVRPFEASTRFAAL